jgi:pilus assembly protein Flp/PilA
MRLILKVQEWMNNLIHKEDGVTAIEYGLIAALIAVAIITAVTTVGTDLVAVFNSIVAALPGGGG